MSDGKRRGQGHQWFASLGAAAVAQAQQADTVIGAEQEPDALLCRYFGRQYGQSAPQPGLTFVSG